MIHFLCAPLRSATVRALASQARGFFIRFLWPSAVEARKLIKVKNCLRRAGLRRSARFQPARLSYLPSPRQRDVLLLSKYLRFAACPSAHSFFLRGYRALVFSAVHSVHSQATCKHGRAHRIRLGCGHRGVGVAFRATIKQERPAVRHCVIFCGSSCASMEYKSRKRVRARALFRFAALPAHVHAFNPYCTPLAFIFFQAFKRLKSNVFRRLASRASKRFALLRALDSAP